MKKIDFHWGIGFDKNTMRAIVVGPYKRYEEAENKSLQIVPSYFPFGIVVTNHIKDYEQLLNSGGKIELDIYLKEHYGYSLNELKEIVKERGWGEDW